jgi:hypothetical protein
MTSLITELIILYIDNPITIKASGMKGNYVSPVHIIVSCFPQYLLKHELFAVFLCNS